MASTEEKVTALEASLAEATKRVSLLETEAITLKAYLKAGTAVAGVFGLVGIWGFTVISSLGSQVSAAEGKLKTLDEKLPIMTKRVDDTMALLSTDAMRKRLDELAPQALASVAAVQLDAKVEAKVSDVRQVVASLNDSVVGFNAVRCPTGWREYAPARDRFLRGIDTTVPQPRAPGSHQADAIQDHTHALTPATTKGHGSSNQAPHGYAAGAYGLQITATDNVSSGARVDNETRPKNVGVLFCTRG